MTHTIIAFFHLQDVKRSKAFVSRRRSGFLRPKPQPRRCVMCDTLLPKGSFHFCSRKCEKRVQDLISLRDK